MRKLIVAAVLFAAASPALAEDCKPLKRYTSIPFRDDGSGRISVPASLGGRATRLTVDTGAYWSSMREDLAQALKLNIKTSYDVVMNDASGHLMNRLALVPEVKIGMLNYGQAEFFVAPAAPGLPIEEDGGLLGQNLLTQVDLELDSAASTISIFSQDHCEAAGVHWADSAVILEYRRGVRPATATRIRQSADKNQIDPPIVRAEIGGQPISVLFDTGASITVMDVDLAKRRFGIDVSSLKPAGKVYVAGGGGVETYEHTLKTLTISGITFENVPLLIGKFPEQSQLILGMHEMKHLHIYFAFKEGRIYVTAADTGKPK